MSATAVALPWEAYSSGSNVDHFVSFASEHCRQSVDEWQGQPLTVEPFQHTMMGEALAFDSSGDPCWRLVVIVLPRKNGKTTLLAAYALYVLLTTDGSPEILLAARTDKQAGRLFNAAEMMVRQSPLLRSLIKVQAYKGEMHRADGFGSLYRFSAESGALDGYNPSLVVADELHAWETPSEKKAFAALVSGFGARKGPQLFTITTAGDPATREDSILGRILDGALDKGDVEETPGLQVARQWAGKTLIYNYISPSRDFEDLASFKLANPASWITEERLAASLQADDLTPSQKLRYHGGIWAADEDDFITAEQWDSLADPEAVAAAFAPGSSVSLGMDGSRVYDCTARSRARLMDDGRIAVQARVFSCRREAPHHVLCGDNKIDFKLFEADIEDQFKTYRVMSGAYDPRYLQRSADMIEEHLGTDQLAAVEPQSNMMRDTWACFYRLAKEGKIAHDGDPVLRAHVVAAKADQDERGWVIRKRHQARPIDALVSSAMAVWRAEVDGAMGEPWMAAW